MATSSLNEQYQLYVFSKKSHSMVIVLKNTLFCLRNEMNQGHEIRSFALNKETKKGQGLKGSAAHLFPNFSLLHSRFRREERCVTTLKKAV